MRTLLLLLGFTALLGLPLLAGLRRTSRSAAGDSVALSSPSPLQRLLADPLRLAVQVVPAALVIAYAFSLFFVSRPASGYSSFWEGWVCTAAELSPLIPIALRIYRSPQVRGAWIFLGLGVTLYNAGNFIYALHDQNLVPIPSPAPSDAAYLASYLALGIGIALFTAHAYAVATPSARLDGAIAGLTLAAGAALFWFGPLLHASGDDFGLVVNMSYPVCDLALLVLLVASLAPMRYRPNLPTALLVLGFIAFVIGDIVYMNRVAAGSYVQGTILDLTWPVGVCLIGVAAFPRPERRTRSRDYAASRGLNLIPVVAALVCVAVIASDLLIEATPVCIMLAIAAITLAIIRMALTQSEVRHLGATSFSDARTDDITGLANSRAFLEAGPDLLSRAGPDQCFGVLLADLDGFKEINDSIGHDAGDQMLRVVAQRFAARVGSTGLVARLGGDEFAVPCLVSSPDELVAVAAAMVNALVDPLSLDGLFVRVEASVGVAWYPAHGASFTELLRCADIAMYAAKQSRSGVCVYDSGSDLHSRHRLALTADLRNAVAFNDLALHYQPILDLATGLPKGVEALVRWPHPREGLLYPDVIIPLAEASGLIVPLTRSVLDLAVAEAAHLNFAALGLSMSVNITNYDLIDERFTELVSGILDAHGVDPSVLILEVTESSLSQNQSATKRTIERLRAMGVRVSIDDFGTGYSSLSDLLTLVVDQVKIDKSFVDGLDSDPRVRPLITAIIEIARAYDLEVVAEGIEDADTLASLTAMGVTSAQGYFIAKPLDPITFERYLAVSLPGYVLSVHQSSPV